jgi:hypothetical protein
MDVKQQERQYRRGLILGLTLAEVMLLVLFSLLLVLLHTFNKNKPLSPAEQSAVRLVDEAVAADGAQPSENDFNDLFESLTILIRKGDAKRIKALTDTIVQLHRSDERSESTRASTSSNGATTRAVTTRSPTTKTGTPSGQPRTAVVTDDSQRRNDAKAARERLDAFTRLLETVRTTGDARTIEEATQITKQVADVKRLLGDKSATSVVREAIARELKDRVSGASRFFRVGKEPSILRAGSHLIPASRITSST